MLRKLRLWERENLPLCKTNKGYDIFLLVADEMMNREPQLKNIYGVLRYSEVTVRAALKHLEIDGWIEFKNKKNDLRVKDLVATEKFNQIFCKWATEIDSIVNYSRDL